MALRGKAFRNRPHPRLVFRLCRRRGKHDELVAADAVEIVPRKLLPQTLCDRAQQLVARLVTALVVDLVQAVRVDINAGGRSDDALVALAQTLLIGDTVHQARALVRNAHTVNAASRRDQVPADVGKIAQQNRADDDRHQVEDLHHAARSRQRLTLAHAEHNAPVVDADRLVVQVERHPRGLGDGAHIAADAVGDLFHRLLVGVALEHFPATQVGEIAERIVPGVHQNVAGISIHDENEGVAAVKVGLVAARELLQRHHAIEDGDGLAVALHRRDVAHHQLFRRKVACDAVGDVRAPRRLRFKIECAGNVVAGAVGQQQCAVGSQQRDGGDKGLIKAEGVHDAQHRIQIVLVLPRDQLRHGGENGLVRACGIVDVLGKLLCCGRQLIEGALCDLLTCAPCADEDRTRQYDRAEQRDRQHDTRTRFVFHFFLLTALSARADSAPPPASAGRARNKSPE